MNSDFLNKDLQNEYEKIKAIIMSEEERKTYKSKIDKLSNRALVDFEEGDTSK